MKKPKDFSFWVALLLVGILVAAAWLTNSLFTFTFGYDIIGEFMFVDLIGPGMSKFISGLICWLFFDVAYTGGIIAFVWVADTFIQRAVLIIQVACTFLFSMVASVISFLLLSQTIREIVPEMLMGALQVAAILTVVVAIVVSALSTVGVFLSGLSIIERIVENGLMAREAMFKLQQLKNWYEISFTTSEEKLAEEAHRFGSMMGASLSEDFQRSWVNRVGKKQEQQPAQLMAADSPTDISDIEVIEADPKRPTTRRRQTK